MSDIFNIMEEKQINEPRNDNEGNREMGNNDRKSVIRITKRDYLMSKVNQLCDFLEKTNISKECSDVKNNISKFRNFDTILALSAKYGESFNKNPDNTLQSFIEPYGFLRSHFNLYEWNTIRGYINVIFKFSNEMVIKPVLNK